tara:strand:- start:8636 stop:9226 length:591 start_codon:yes stop_codon:yes gene_type:complete
MRKLIIILTLLLSSASIYTQDREQMRQMVSEYMKKIGIENDQIQNSMILVRKIMMEYVNEMEISKESSEKLKNYSDKQSQALKDLAKKLIKLRSENRSKSNFEKPNKRQGPARPDVGDPIFEKIVEYLREQGINRENFRDVFTTVRDIRLELIKSTDKSKFKPSKKYIKNLKNSGLSDDSIDRLLDLIKAMVGLEK